MSTLIRSTVEHHPRSYALTICCALLLAGCGGTDDGPVSSESGAGTSSGAGMSASGGSGGASGGASPTAGAPSAGGSPSGSGASSGGASGGTADGGQPPGETSVLPGSICVIGPDMDTARFSVELSQPVLQKRLAFRLKWSSSGTPCSGEVGLFGAGRADQSVRTEGFEDTATVTWQDGWLFVHQAMEEDALRDTFEVGILVKDCNEGYESSDVRLDANSGGPGDLVAECTFY